MSKKENKSNNNNKNKMLHERLAGRYATNLRLGESRALATVYRLKKELSISDLFAIFPKIPELNKHLTIIYGEPFPKNLSAPFRTAVLGRPTSMSSELTWAICRCLQYSTELKTFAELRQKFEESILENNKEECFRILQKIENLFGVSTWLVQSKLCAAQNWDGFEGTHKIDAEYRRNAEDNPILSLLLWFIKKRIEATAVKDNLESELKEFTANYDETLRRYIHCKILDQVEMPSDSMAAMMFYEAHSSIIDTYEALISALNAAAVQDLMPKKVRDEFSRPVSILFDKTKDSRLIGSLRVLGAYCEQHSKIDEDRASAIELYTDGDYKGFLLLSDEVIRRNPSDMYIFAQQIRAHMALGIETPAYEGIKGQVASNLRSVLELSDKTYISAHALLVLAGRFYTQTWVNYIKSLVMHKVGPEETIFPPYWLRDVILKDPHSSPFSLLASRGAAKQKLLDDAGFLGRFSKTMQLYRSAECGEYDKNTSVATHKIKRNLARFYLSNNRPIEAIDEYRWLYTNSAPKERLRHGGGLALAHLKNKDFNSSAKVIVESFLEHPNFPSVIPIKEVVGALPDPTNWPNCISIPFVLELHLEFYDSSKLPELRYAFEKYHLDNNINEPDDLISSLQNWDDSVIIAYLDRVWRPEIMRKTLIYNGTRAIEEARIRVCQKLVELDPNNAARYSEEIKDRVKQQAIARGMSLVEQSKVYVDIDAIKKALKGRLSDTYARYKTITPSQPSATDQIMESLSKFLLDTKLSGDTEMSRLLSNIAVLGAGSTSESDAQFDSLYTEVTKEFLKGAHGLNAYLSTRVRHGTLSNTLRKAVEDEKLVTNKEEKRGTYLPNEHWASSIAEDSYPKEHAQLKDALYSFSQEFDGILDYIKDKLLQIRIINESGLSEDDREALFIYNSSRIERKAAQIEDRDISDIEQFIEKCVDLLWEKTDRNLESVQKVFSTVIRDRMTQTFDKLISSISTLHDFNVHGDLLNAIIRARTNTRNRLDTVTSWFKRNEVYDRQDYTADFPVHIAVNMIKNAMSIASSWSGFEITLDEGSKLMPGRTLDGMVYVFYGLIENAIKHSKLDIHNLSATVKISFAEGKYHAIFRNSVAVDKITEEEIAKVEQIRQSIKLKESTRRAQGEGSSGLHKIWLTANGPVHKEASLEFDWEGNEFVVDLKFSIEGV